MKGYPFTVHVPVVAGHTEEDNYFLLISGNIVDIHDYEITSIKTCQPGRIGSENLIHALDMFDAGAKYSEPIKTALAAWLDMQADAQIDAAYEHRYNSIDDFFNLN